MLWILCSVAAFGWWVGVGFVCGQVFKGTRWMPWHQEPMKDVGACDKPRGAGNRAVIRGCPNGETQSSRTRLPTPEHIGRVEETRGSETSQDRKSTRLNSSHANISY